MGLSVGIVGLPNVGKSTLFNLLTSAGVAAENYPFCTIDPNKGTVGVPHEALSFLSEFLGSARVFPGIMEFVDIAGLVKGASKGEGLGNRFLAHIRETDAIMEVIRCFHDPDVEHRTGQINPPRDAEIVEQELILSDIEILEGIKEKTERKVRGQEKGAKERFELVTRLIALLEEGKSLRYFPFTQKEKNLLEGVHLLTSKPLIYIANVDEGSLVGEGDEGLNSLKEYASQKSVEVIPVSLKIEEELTHLDGEERNYFLEELGISSGGVERVIQGGFQLLDLITFFTGVGNEELRAWNIKRGTTASQAAGKVHSDMEKGFIKAEVININIMEGLASFGEAKQKGLLRIEGKGYPVQEGDLCYFHFRI